MNTPASTKLRRGEPSKEAIAATEQFCKDHPYSNIPPKPLTRAFQSAIEEAWLAGYVDGSLKKIEP